MAPDPGLAGQHEATHSGYWGSSMGKERLSGRLRVPGLHPAELPRGAAPIIDSAAGEAHSLAAQRGKHLGAK